MVAFSKVKQSGVLPYRVERGALRVMMVRSLDARRWILPKGHIEPGLTQRESAEHEAYEEAGVAGTIGARAVGSYTYRKRRDDGGYYCRVRIYPLKVKRVFDEYPEARARERAWMKISQAMDSVVEPGLKRLLARFAARHRRGAL